MKGPNNNVIKSSDDFVGWESKLYIWVGWRAYIQTVGSVSYKNLAEHVINVGHRMLNHNSSFFHLHVCCSILVYCKQKAFWNKKWCNETYNVDDHTYKWNHVKSRHFYNIKMERNTSKIQIKGDKKRMGGPNFLLCGLIHQLIAIDKTRNTNLNKKQQIHL